jgi:SNF2 family DNA or RNA helicase
MLENIELITETKMGTRLRNPVTIERVDGRINFVKSPFPLKNEIKAMQGSKWHQYIDGDNRKMWSVADSVRNNFQLEVLTVNGGNPYANWDQPLKEHSYLRPLYQHQKLMADHCLTYHYQILAAEMGVGKSAAAIEVMERSGSEEWWYVAPKSGIAAVEREFEKWGLAIQPNMMTYDRLRIEIERWEKGRPAPMGVILDESSRAKTATAKRTKAAQHLADSIRAEYGWDGYVILMSGTPSPKSPVDWWSQCEICYPGFLREGDHKQFEWRLGIFQKQKTDQGEFWKRVSWRDDALKCDVCGEYEEHENHSTDDIFGLGDSAHIYTPTKNEVAYLYERLDGLVLPLAKKDCLDIPDKIYREVILEPTSTVKRVAKALAGSAISVIQGLTWLRELSDGFQYSLRQDGEETCVCCKGAGEAEDWYDNPETGEVEKGVLECPACEGTGNIPHMVRDTKSIKCPKDQAIRDLLEENEDQGRMIVFAGFQGSIDRVVDICHKQQWDVVKVDGRGWKILTCDGEKPPRKVKPLDYWADLTNERVVFVAHPASGGMGLTLTEARMSVFYSNDYTPESRAQAEDRIHRPGIDKNRGATIVDLFHLGTDRKVLNVLRDNRRLEQMTLTEMREML